MVVDLVVVFDFGIVIVRLSSSSPKGEPLYLLDSISVYFRIPSAALAFETLLIVLVTPHPSQIITERFKTIFPRYPYLT